MEAALDRMVVPAYICMHVWYVWYGAIIMHACIHAPCSHVLKQLELTGYSNGMATWDSGLLPFKAATIAGGDLDFPPLALHIREVDDIRNVMVACLDLAVLGELVLACGMWP